MLAFGRLRPLYQALHGTQQLLLDSTGDRQWCYSKPEKWSHCRLQSSHHFIRPQARNIRSVNCSEIVYSVLFIIRLNEKLAPTMRCSSFLNLAFHLVPEMSEDLSILPVNFIRLLFPSTKPVIEGPVFQFWEHVD